MKDHRIGTRGAIAEARNSYLSRKLNPTILLSDLYQLRIQKEEMSLAHNAFSKLIRQHDNVYTQ